VALALFGGSRSLAPSSAPLVRSVVSAWLASGGSVSVGCSAGADALVVECVPPASARVFAAFAPGGVGACGVSAVAAVSAFGAAGGSVSWLAGGALSLPLAARLIRRSLAALAGCSVAVFFSPGSGSLAVAGAAVARGLPVFAFCAVPPAAPRGAAGAWVVSSWCGLSCWSWSPAAVQPALF
jgi:hypothetical protein